MSKKRKKEMHKKSRFIFGFVVLALLSVGAAFTLHSQEQNGQKQNQASSVSDGKIKVCDRDAALDDYFCEVENLKIFEKRMDQQMQRLLASIRNDYWGKDADTEIKNRIITTQEAWRKYRDGQCRRYYYSKSSSHPPSSDYAITFCRVTKTKERIKEIEHSVQ